MAARAISSAIATQGLLTGCTIERPGATGAKLGVGRTPSLVVTVRFEGVERCRLQSVLARSQEFLLIEDRDAA
jgi:hypothetical protein